MKSLDAIKQLSEITAYQWGMFTSAQADRVGVPRYSLSRLESFGQIERLQHGVYRIVAAPPDEYEELRALWLKFRPKLFAYERIASPEEDFIVVGQTAAILHGMADYRMDRFEFAHNGRRQTRVSHVILRNRAIDSSAIIIKSGLPATNSQTTYQDLVRQREDMSSVRLDEAGDWL